MNPSLAGDNNKGRIYLLPNLLTAGNFFCGFAALIKILDGEFKTGIWLILLSYVFDALDGRVARLVGRESDFGREFDSLADSISFGIAPACLAYKFVLVDFPRTGLFISCVYAVCGVIRLARFDMLSVRNSLLAADKKQTAASKDFIGLPIPAAAGVIVSLALFLLWYYEPGRSLGAWRFTLPPFMLLVSVLMVSKVKYPSFKAIDWTTQLRLVFFVGLLVTICFAIIFHEGVLPLLFISYLIYGLVRPYISKRLRREIEQEEPEEPEEP